MNFVNSMAFTAITFVAFTALVAIISWWKTRGDNLETQDGYYLGGRSLTGPVIAGSLLMTNLSAEQLVGNNGQAVRVGMSTMGWEVTSAIALVILAFVLMPKYLKTGLTTVPQFFEQRYDEGTRRLVSIIVLLSYVVIMLPNILYAGAQVFVNIFGIDEIFGISRFAAIAIVCVATAIVGSIYAIFGGLKAIALSDSINGLGLIVGGLLVPVFGFMFLSGQLGGDGSFVDGFDKFLHTDPSYLNAINEVSTPEPTQNAYIEPTATPEPTPEATDPVKILESVPLDAQTQSAIFELCGSDPDTFCAIMAIARTESHFDTDAVGDNGVSIGMMQINTRWHTGRMEALGVTDLTDPVQCAAVALDYLRELSEGYGFRWITDHDLYMAYNMGPGNARTALNAGTTSSHYSRSVLAAFGEYAAEMEAAA